jgi:chorismate mutase
VHATCNICRARSDANAGSPPQAVVRAVRGAIQVDCDCADDILAATGELLGEVMGRNELLPHDLISVWFTATPDLTSVFPAAAARDQLGLTELPMLCATEIDVPGAMPRVIRLLAHIQTARPPAEIKHVYLRGAAQLRTDISSSTA